MDTPWTHWTHCGYCGTLPLLFCAQEVTSEFASIWGHAITPLVDIVWFTFRLQSLVGLSGMSSLLVYAGVSGAVLKMFMPDHEKFGRKEKENESAFRFIHTRLRDHAESVRACGCGCACACGCACGWVGETHLGVCVCVWESILILEYEWL